MPPLLCRRTHAPAALTARREWVVRYFPARMPATESASAYPNPVKEDPPLK